MLKIQSMFKSFLTALICFCFVGCATYPNYYIEDSTIQMSQQTTQPVYDQPYYGGVGGFVGGGYWGSGYDQNFYVPPVSGPPIFPPAFGPPIMPGPMGGGWCW